MLYNTIQHSTAQYSTIQCDSVRPGIERNDSGKDTNGEGLGGKTQNTLCSIRNCRVGWFFFIFLPSVEATTRDLLDAAFDPCRSSTSVPTGMYQTRSLPVILHSFIPYLYAIDPPFNGGPWFLTGRWHPFSFIQRRSNESLIGVTARRSGRRPSKMPEQSVSAPETGLFFDADGTLLFRSLGKYVVFPDKNNEILSVGESRCVQRARVKN